MVAALQTPSAETLLGWRTLGGRSTLRNILVAFQIAISITLLTGAGLLVRSLWNLQQVPLGFPTQELTTFNVVLGQQRYPSLDAQSKFFDRLEQRLSEFSGITAYTLSDSIPLGSTSRSNPLSFVQYEGQREIPEGFGGKVVWRLVTPSYFSTLRIPLLFGRGFEVQDRLSSSDVIILSETLARRLFGMTNPVHQIIRFGGKGAPFEIVGVAGDVRNAPVAESNLPEFYRLQKTATLGEPPQQYDFGKSANVTVRSSMSPSRLSAEFGSIVASLDPTVPVTVEPMALRASKLTRRSSFNALVLTLFSVIGLCLAAVGLYGVLAFIVTQRTQEIGVRIALGSTGAAILRLILGHAIRWTAVGTAIGLAGSYLAGHWLQSFLYGVHAHDQWSGVVAIALLFLVAMIAAGIPSWRASRTDPLVALRHD